MSNPLQEVITQLREEKERSEDKPDNRPLMRTIAEGMLQGATKAVPLSPRSETIGASVDIDRDITTERHRISPRTQISIGTYTLQAGIPLTISLPRWVRQVIIQNNTDQGGTSNVITRSIDGTPATPGDYMIRQGQTVSDDVFTHTLSLYCASANTINGSGAGIVVEVAS